ncbi:thiamine phosphate synthase [Flavobacterium sp. RHBU_3]|uniref:thiamine phosphate synthase n=1 Tax=Flavobacterium sp. RHBU_3 TaxID=3391184 RepID=UPI0039848626
MHPFPFKLYLVISEEACAGRSLLWVAEQAVRGGVDVVQLREKHKTTAAFTETARQLKALLDTYNVPLIINDKIKVAMAVNAAGLHVGNNDLPPKEVKRLWPECQHLGWSVEYLEQLDSEQMQYVNHLGVSPVFNTVTKTDTVTEWGLSGIEKIRSLTDVPLVAIGNMNAANARAVIKAGADCIAVVSAICAAADPKLAAMEILKQIENHD